MKLKGVVHTDGGARGNPGPAGIGVVIDYNGRQHLYKEYIGEATNNQAEYRALIMGLEKAAALNIEELDVYLDSELVQQQVNGAYKVKNQGLGDLFLKVWNLKQQFKKIKFIHVMRTSNKLADKLVNQAIDEATKKI